MKRPLRTRALLVALLLLVPALGTASCGSGGPLPEAPPPFVAQFPAAPPNGDPTPPEPTPPAQPPKTPVFDADAYAHERNVLFGAFPSDVLRHGYTIFTTDGDQITADGALIVPVDVSGPVPRDSVRYVPVRIHATDLVDSQGGTPDVGSPIGFGFFLNDLEIVHDHLAFVLVGAGGSDSTPTLSNLVAFDPSNGTVLQTVDLANHRAVPPGQLDSSSTPVPQGGFVQSGAEALEYVPTFFGRGRLYVAMTNILFGPPSYGTVKYPGTIQVFDIATDSFPPVHPRPRPGLVTETLDVGGFNPVAIQRFTATGTLGLSIMQRLLVTVAGTTAYDANFQLVPVTDASVAVYDDGAATFLGRFLLGRTGLSATRPALGRDAAGHRVGFFPSSVTGEVYLLRLDGLYDTIVDASRLAVLRGPNNGIPIASQQAGGPGGNITSVGLAPDGRTLVVAGFGNLFAWPDPEPGRLYLLGLPEDLVTGSGFGVDFVPGDTLHGTVPGRALGALALVPNGGSRPDVYVAVSSPLDSSTFLAQGPASLGSLQTFGLIR